MEWLFLDWHFRLEKLCVVGGWPVGLKCQSQSQSLSSGLWDLDLGPGFSTWIWDLDMGLDMGLTILLKPRSPFQTPVVSVSTVVVSSAPRCISCPVYTVSSLSPSASLPTSVWSKINTHSLHWHPASHWSAGGQHCLSLGAGEQLEFLVNHCT